jgi:hypothetical protein
MATYSCRGCVLCFVHIEVLCNSYHRTSWYNSIRTILQLIFIPQMCLFVCLATCNFFSSGNTCLSELMFGLCSGLKCLKTVLRAEMCIIWCLVALSGDEDANLGT